MDGVLTRTATVHMAAWKRTFDQFLRATHPDQREFTQDDYNRFVDGKPRLDGVRDFLASRGIHLPEGTAGDPGDAQTGNGLGTRKNELLLRELHEHGGEVYPASPRFPQAGKFGYVVGVDRVGHADDLRAHGADVVVTDLDQLLEDRP